MSRDFTDFRSSLMHYGVQGMEWHTNKKVKKPEYYPWDTAEDRANKQKAYTKQLIAEQQAKNRYAAAISPTGKGLPAVRNSEVGSYKKDKQFMKKHNIPSAYATKHGRVTFDKPTQTNKLRSDRMNPQEIINNRRRKLTQR